MLMVFEQIPNCSDVPSGRCALTKVVLYYAHKWTTVSWNAVNHEWWKMGGVSVAVCGEPMLFNLGRRNA